MQDPLVEFSQLCTNDDEILCLRYHPLQVNGEKTELEFRCSISNVLSSLLGLRCSRRANGSYHARICQPNERGRC